MQPEGTAVTTEQLLQYIGQLYVQTQIYQQLLATQSRQLIERPRGNADGKVESLDPAIS